MGDAGWWPIIGFAALVDPVIVALGVLIGAIARRWAHVVLSGLLVPAGWWGFNWLLHRVDHFWSLLPLIAGAGMIWSGAAFSVKRALSA